ncbi:hypothetical protein [Paenibacillus sp. DMB5]|uniref:DUF7667 family protein n=1 Tax=Paenibacillus sp. DMB5 TaxID=1780103 RepID=UPI00076BC2B1|nr:hypothetical protein [Paenibacillus sp. DMB5]KUP26350.1 hypothetical protein AWJ19_32600 [Paenibacillus sp. DMB5]
MLLIHQRLAELYTISRMRPLTPAELTEQEHCLHANSVYCWEISRLNMEGQLAARTGDALWQEEIQAQLLEVQCSGKAARRRKE